MRLCGIAIQTKRVSSTTIAISHIADVTRMIRRSRMPDLRFPTIEGALEIAGHLGIDPDTINFECQDWEYTYPTPDQLQAFITTYQERTLSDAAKRVLGCFIFQALDDYLGDGGAEALVRDTLEMLVREYRIHEPEFRYWSLVDLDDEERGKPEDWFYITRFAIRFVA